MKTSLLKLFVTGLLFCFAGTHANAQRYITNTYGYACYNLFDNNTVDNTNNNNPSGVYAPGFLPDPNVSTNNTSVVLSSAGSNNLSTVAGGRCLTSKYQVTPLAIAANFIQSPAAASYSSSIDNNDWEWSFIYKSNLGAGVYPTNANSSAAVVTTNKNSWRYWLHANSSTINSSSSGFYVTQNNDGKLYVYVQSGGTTAQLLVSNSVLTNGTAYCIKIQRKGVAQIWKMYLDPYSASVPSAVTKQTVTASSDNQTIGKAYTNSILEAENVSGSDGAFQFDELNMYTRYVSFTNITSAANNITQPPYYGGQGSINLWGVQILIRGNYEFGTGGGGDMYIKHTDVGNPEGNFVNSLNTCNIYKTINPYFSTATAIGVMAPLSVYNGTGNAQTSGFSDNETGQGNYDGTLSTSSYWFINATINSSITTGTSITFNGVAQVSEKDNNSVVTGTPEYQTGPTITATAGYGYDWNGAGTAWGTSTNWTPLGSAPAGVPGSTDIARIAVNTGLAWVNQPTIGAGTTNVGSIILGNKINNANNAYVTLTANGTVNVGGTITQNSTWPSTNPAIVTANTIAGSGAISATGLIIGDGSTSSAAQNSGLIINMSGSLTLSGDISFNSTVNGVYLGPANLVTNGTTTLQAARITTNNPSASARSAFQLSSGTTVKLTGATPFSNSSTGISFYSFGGTVNYSGASQKVFVDLNQGGGTGYYANLTFSGSGTKTTNISSPILVSGNFTTSNAIADFSATNPSMTFLGSANQTITNSSGAVLTFKNLIFGTAASTAATYTKTLAGANGFAIADDGVLTISNTGTDKTAITAAGLLTLKSSATSSGSIAQIPSPSATGNRIDGNVTVQRYFTGGTAASRAYRLLGFPVNNNTVVANSGGNAYYNLSGISTGLFTGGPSGPGAGFTVTNPGASTVFLYRENTPPSTSSFNNGNYRGLATLGVNPFQIVNQGSTYSLWAGGGAMVFYVGSYSGGAYSTKPFPNPDNANISYTGTLNQGSIPVKLWYNASTSFTYTSPAASGGLGCTLVGNPYASAIDWDTFSASASTNGIYGPNISTTIYQYNYSSKNFGAYTVNGVGGLGTNNSSRYIASGQGFFVLASSSSAALTFNENAKTTTQPYSLGSAKLLMGTPLASAKQQGIRIKHAKDSVNTEDIIVTFEPDATNGYDSELEAVHLAGIGNIVSLSSNAKGDGPQLAINHMHSIDASTRIRLNVGSTISGTDTLTISGVSTLDKRYIPYLLDHFKKDTVLFSDAKPYLFDINVSDTSTYGSTRFELMFNKNTEYTKYKLLSFTAKKISAGVQLTWTVENELDAVGFSVQRADGSQKIITFQNLYSVQSDGKGTYTYIDKSPLATTGKYRLMQNDAFETVTYSGIVTIEPEAPVTKDVITIYPNPVAATLQINLNTEFTGSQVHLMMMNTNGLVFLNKDIGVSNLNQNVSTLLPGSYIVELSDPTTKKIIGRKKFIKI